MVAATAAPNAGTDSVALRLWASLSSCSYPKEIPHGDDPRTLYAEALLADVHHPARATDGKGVTLEAILINLSYRMNIE